MQHAVWLSVCNYQATAHTGLFAFRRICENAVPRIVPLVLAELALLPLRQRRRFCACHRLKVNRWLCEVLPRQRHMVWPISRGLPLRWHLLIILFFFSGRRRRPRGRRSTGGFQKCTCIK